eukprot:1071143-Prymnesium_polylepis.1
MDIVPEPDMRMALSYVVWPSTKVISVAPAAALARQQANGRSRKEETRLSRHWVQRTAWFRLEVGAVDSVHDDRLWPRDCYLCERKPLCRQEGVREALFVQAPLKWSACPVLQLIL